VKTVTLKPVAQEQILGGLWGALVGDALGVPVEFRSREEITQDPVTDLRGYGSHHQPPGTWSDDSSLLLCTIDSLLQREFDPQHMGENFVRWLREGFWSARGEVFDIGLGTMEALDRIANGTHAEHAGGREESNNGNGSLMRILPIAIRFAHEPPEMHLERVQRASAVTHGHPRSRMSCAFYSLIVRRLLQGEPPEQALVNVRREFTHSYAGDFELNNFNAILEESLADKPDHWIVSTGYVIHTLTASVWCLLTTKSYEACVLAAVNLGGDTDTTACVAGGLAGVYYGSNAIPERWRRGLARSDELGLAFNRFADLCRDSWA
jgi:ADP-ribosylglycohydrolase